MKFRVQKNTDNIDIDNKCLGLSVWVEGDSLSLLNTNRGLHTQIRHNGNKEQFDAANKLASLYSAAADLLSSSEAMSDVLASMDATLPYEFRVKLIGQLRDLRNAIKKAQGL